MKYYRANSKIIVWNRCSVTSECFYAIIGKGVTILDDTDIPIYTIKCSYCGRIKEVAQKYNGSLYSLEETFDEVSILVTLRATV